MKRPSLNSGLIGLLLAAGLVVVPTAAASTTVDPEPTPTPTATESVTPTPDATEGADPTTGATESTATETPDSPTAGATETAGQTATGETSPAATDSASSPASDSSTAGTSSTVDPSSTVGGDPGTVIESEQFSDEASIVGIYRNGCTLTFEIAIQVTGTYTIEVWDDGEKISTLTVTGEAGTTQTATYTIGAQVGTQAPGYGFTLLYAESTGVQSIEVQRIEWDFEGSESVMAQCAAAATSSTAKPTPQLAKTGAATGALAVGALALAGAGVALRRARSRA